MKRTQAQSDEYRATAVKAVEKLGATHTGDIPYEYTIATKAGALRISIGDDGTVCTRFQLVERAKELGLGGRLNIYSGKWNWMGGMTHEEDLYDLALFQSELRKIV